MCFRLARFLETAGSVLNYFKAFLGRIEILGGSKRIERVYFEIKESNLEQWEKPQIKVCILIFLYFLKSTLFEKLGLLNLSKYSYFYHIGTHKYVLLLL